MNSMIRGDPDIHGVISIVILFIVQRICDRFSQDVDVEAEMGVEMCM